MDLNKLTKAELINRVEELEKQLYKLRTEIPSDLDEDSDDIQKLIHNEEFELLMKVFPGALSLFDGNGILVDISQKSELVWGFSKDEVIGKQAFDFIHKDDLADTIQIWNRAIRETFAEDYEARLLTRSGNYIHCSFNGTFLKDENGKFIGALIIATDNSESKRIMEELKLSEEWHKAIYNNASVYVTVNDLNLFYIHANIKFIHELKYSMQELKKMTSFDITYKDDKNESGELLDKLIKGEIGNYRIEKRFIKKDGDIIWVDMSVDTLKNSKGQIEAIICVSSDISDRKAAERKLLDSTEMLRTVLDTIPARVFWKDSNSVYMGCNKICAEDAGLSDPAEMIGKTEYELNLPEVAEDYIAHDRKVLETGTIDTNYEMSHRKIDGSMQWLKISKVPLKDGSGKTIGILGTYDDITSHKLTEERIIESELKFRTLFSDAVDGIVLADAYTGIISDCNKAFQALFGYDKEELIGLHQSRLHPNTPKNDELMESFIRHRESEDSIPIESEIIKKNGEVRSVEVKASPIIIQGTKYLMGIFRDITDKKKAEIELKESEEKYRLLFDDNPHPMWVYDMETLKFLAVNHKATQKYGYGLEEFLAMDITQIRPQEDIPKLLKNVNVHKIGIKDEGNWRHITKDGLLIDVNIISNVINFEGKKAELILALDITDNLKILSELAEREAKLKGILNSAPIGIGIIINDTISEVNDKICEMTGYSGEELIHTRAEFFYDTLEDFDNVRLGLEEGIFKNGKASLEANWKKKTGEKINVLLSSTFIDGDNPGMGVIITALDITERKKAELALMDSEERYRSLFKEMMNAFAYHQLITDDNNNPVDYIFLEVNPAWEEMTGLKAGDVIGKSVREVIPGIEEHWIKNFGSVAISGKPIHIEDYVADFDRYYEVISYSNKPGFFAVIFSEVTARKKAEIEIQKMNELLEKKVSDRTEQLNNILNELRLENDKHTVTRKKLERALSELRKSLDKEKEVNMMKTRFISMISHEYRTPLTVILSSTYLIERYIGKNEKADSHLKKIQSSVNLMTNLLEDVITVGKSEEDMLGYIPAIIDLPLEINRLLEEVRIIDNNNHTIEFINELSQNKVLSDVKHLRHIILNLLTNACKYSPPGKTVRISTIEDGDRITISVLDEGIGIPESDIQHIFEPFFRNKDYIGQIPGSGLGLTIVKRSSDAIGGIITFESRVNEGTEFKLNFPFKGKN